MKVKLKILLEYLINKGIRSTELLTDDENEAYKLAEKIKDQLKDLNFIDNIFNAYEKYAIDKSINAVQKLMPASISLINLGYYDGDVLCPMEFSVAGTSAIVETGYSPKAELGYFISHFGNDIDDILDDNNLDIVDMNNIDYIEIAKLLYNYCGLDWVNVHDYGEIHYKFDLPGRFTNDSDILNDLDSVFSNDIDKQILKNLYSSICENNGYTLYVYFNDTKIEFNYY